eukprot:5377354-Pleurochrysis_carterae.AAC.1
MKPVGAGPGFQENYLVQRGSERACNDVHCPLGGGVNVRGNRCYELTTQTQQPWHTQGAAFPFHHRREGTDQ